MLVTFDTVSPLPALEEMRTFRFAHREGCLSGRYRRDRERERGECTMRIGVRREDCVVSRSTAAKSIASQPYVYAVY